MTTRETLTRHEDFILYTNDEYYRSQLDNRPSPARENQQSQNSSLPSLSSQDDNYSLDQCAHQPPHLVSLPFLLGLVCYKVGTLGPEHPKNNDIRYIPDSDNQNSQKKKVQQHSALKITWGTHTDLSTTH